MEHIGIGEDDIGFITDVISILKWCISVKCGDLHQAQPKVKVIMPL